MDPPRNAADQGREYGCKYCTKAFTNKQALGGHQNAHKIQRAMEKATFQSSLQGDNHFGNKVGVGGPVTYPVPSIGPYNRSPDFFDRSVVNNFRYNAPQQQQQQQHQGMRMGCNVYPGLSLAGNAYSMTRPIPGCNNFLPRWTASQPRGIIRQFPGHDGRYVQNNGLNFRFPDNGTASRSGMSMGSRPVYPGLSGFTAARIRPGGGDNRNGTNEDESGLDLSLKL